jgi:hypothetical protein
MMMFFWVLDVTLTLKMETVCFSKMLASACEPTQCQNPEQHPHSYSHEKLQTSLGYLIFSGMTVVI